MKVKHYQDLKELLDAKAQQYERPDFITDDPIQIPHRFHKKEDIEIAGFLTAIIAWGQRPSILRSANNILGFLDHSPHEYLLNASKKDLIQFPHFVHRTFNLEDLTYFLTRLQEIYRREGGLETKMQLQNSECVAQMLSRFKQDFFSVKHQKRSEKHLADPLKSSSAKRLNMFLRWMVRPNNKGVDFGIWNNIKPSQLMMPLDVHTGTIGRKIELLDRKQNDWKAVEELTNNLIEFDSEDPIKYDFALFGMGVNKDL